ncbi:MAG: hypothetical protein ABFR95_00835 [Actinomycetota bacterium]
MAVLVVYESKQDRTREVADAIADAAAEHSIASLIRTIDETTPEQVASSSGVIAGCTTAADVPFGGKPTQHIAQWINGLDSLEGKPVGVYCAYKFFPHTFADTTTRVSETLSKLGARFELRGGQVFATQGINLKSMEKGANELVDQLLGHLPNS